MNTALHTPDRALVDTNRFEIAEAQGHSNSDARLIRAASAALVDFKEDPQACIDHFTRQTKTDLTDAVIRTDADRLRVQSDIDNKRIEVLSEALAELTCESLYELNTGTVSRSCSEISIRAIFYRWLESSMTEDGYDPADVTRAMELVWDNKDKPKSIQIKLLEKQRDEIGIELNRLRGES